MSLHRFHESRLGLERFTELGVAIRRRRPESPRGTVVYIHGLGESGLCFESVMSDPRLNGWEHIAVDLIGYGRSAWSEQPFGLEQHAASIELVLEKLGVGEVVLLGHSMGSVIALMVVERGRIDVSFVLDVEGNVTLDDCAFSSRADAFSPEAWLEEGYSDFLSSVHQMATDGEAAEAEGDVSKERAPVMRAYAASSHFCDPRTLHLDSVDLVRESKTEKLAARRAAAGVPMVYFHGAPRGTGGYSLGQLEDAGIKRRSFEPAGHWPFLDQHDDFVEAMAEILDFRVS